MRELFFITTFALFNLFTFFAESRENKRCAGSISPDDNIEDDAAGPRPELTSKRARALALQDHTQTDQTETRISS